MTAHIIAGSIITDFGIAAYNVGGGRGYPQTVSKISMAYFLTEQVHIERLWSSP